MTITFRLLLSLLLAGCSSPAFVGTEMWHNQGKLDTSRATEPLPSNFAVKPEEVLKQFRAQCGGVYGCNIYADEKNYYLTPDSLSKFCLNIKTCASVIVDGRTGKQVLKQ